ncbi:MAG: hypothetical protein Q9160_000390 [Pyrenula sp. 1 TL-2023]
MSSQDPNARFELIAKQAEHNRDKLCKVDAAQKEFHDWLKKKNLISEEEKRCLDYESYHDVASHWAGLSEQTKINFDRQRGWRRWARKYQSFAAGADQFMKDFNPIVEWAQAAGGPYSGLAIGTICALFTIAGNKSTTDDVISSAIAGVKDRLPGFQMYKEIYKEREEWTDRLNKSILLAYTGFIELAIEATKYYLKTDLSMIVIPHS